MEVAKNARLFTRRTRPVHTEGKAMPETEERTARYLLLDLRGSCN